MSISYQDRNAKLEWLTRPIELAYVASIFGGFVGALMWWNGVSIENVAIAAIGSNIIAAVLLFWGSCRISRAADGRR